MSRIILCGIKTKMQWKMKFEADPETYNHAANMLTLEHKWTAWPTDNEVKESGAPVLSADCIEDLVAKINLFEQGVLYESDIDK